MSINEILHFNLTGVYPAQTCQSGVHSKLSRDQPSWQPFPSETMRLGQDVRVRAKSSIAELSNEDIDRWDIAAVVVSGAGIQTASRTSRQSATRPRIQPTPGTGIQTASRTGIQPTPGTGVEATTRTCVEATTRTCVQTGLLHDQVTSDLWCRVAPLEGCSPCRSPIPKSSVTTSCA